MVFYHAQKYKTLDPVKMRRWVRVIEWAALFDRLLSIGFLRRSKADTEFDFSIQIYLELKVK